ncbi:MAG: response regulator [Dehalococcoidia bacterium]
MGENEKQPAKVLVVDDEQHIRDVIVRSLKRAGYAATGAANADDALFQLAQEEFDVAFLDIRMPGMDGLQLLQKMKSDFPNTKAIMLTGKSDEESVLDSIVDGAVSYLVKPCSLQRLLESLRKALTSRVSKA